LDGRIKFFNGSPLVRNVGEAARSETGHAIDSLLEWRSSPQNNRKWAA
jgi:hypothetical protein